MSNSTTDWLRVWDSKAYAFYWVNIVSHKSTWVQPDDWSEEKENKELKQFFKKQHTSNNMQNWIQMKTSDGIVYWANPATQESRWTKPPDLNIEKKETIKECQSSTDKYQSGEQSRTLKNENLVLLKRMKGIDGVTIQDRTCNLQHFSQCFVGSELVTWMVKQKVSENRAAAVDIGENLRRQGAFVHVTLKHKFEDKFFLYRFSNGQNSQSTSARMKTHQASNSKKTTKEKIQRRYSNPENSTLSHMEVCTSKNKTRRHICRSSSTSQIQVDHTKKSKLKSRRRSKSIPRLKTKSKLKSRRRSRSTPSNNTKVVDQSFSRPSPSKEKEYEKRVIIEMMTNGFTPTLHDLDMSSRFLQPDGSCAIGEILKQIREGTVIIPPVFYLNSSYLNTYIKVTILNEQDKKEQKKEEEKEKMNQKDANMKKKKKNRMKRFKEKNALMFSLQQQSSRRLFHRHLKSEYSEENFTCYQAIENFKSKTDKDKVHIAQDIGTKYLRINSPYQVNISAKLRKDALACLEKGDISQDIFDKVQDAVFSLMAEPFSRFQKTKECKMHVIQKKEDEIQEHKLKTRITKILGSSHMETLCYIINKNPEKGDELGKTIIEYSQFKMYQLSRNIDQPKYQIGQHVSVRWNTGEFHNGTVLSVCGNTYTIKYYNGDVRQTTEEQNIVPTDPLLEMIDSLRRKEKNLTMSAHPFKVRHLRKKIVKADDLYFHLHDIASPNTSSTPNTPCSPNSEEDPPSLLKLLSSSSTTTSRPASSTVIDLDLTIISANYIPKRNHVSKDSVYVINVTVQKADWEYFTLSVTSKGKTYIPVWNEVLRFTGLAGEHLVMIHLLDKNKHGSQHIGYCTWNLGQLIPTRFQKSNEIVGEFVMSHKNTEQVKKH